MTNNTNTYVYLYTTNNNTQNLAATYALVYIQITKIKPYTSGQILCTVQ